MRQVRHIGGLDAMEAAKSLARLDGIATGTSGGGNLLNLEQL